MEDKYPTAVIEWLLEGDPAIRWQVERDLLERDPQEYNRTRKLISQDGWGAKLLSLQDPIGTWGNGFYSPKWISTHYTLISLARLGLDPANSQARKSCQLYLDKVFYQPDGGINISASYQYSDTCVTGMALNFLAYFQLPDPRLPALLEHLIQQQMDDGGWNCDSYKGATHSSFHTTISVLEGIFSYQQNFGIDPLITSARERAQEFLLQHRLYRSHRTGEIVNQRMTRFPFPPRWFYDVLRALDHFQAAGANTDSRFQDAIDLLLTKQDQNQTWSNYRGPSGRQFFEFEAAGKPGRMNTLRALRVLKWWDAGQDRILHNKYQ